MTLTDGLFLSYVALFCSAWVVFYWRVSRAIFTIPIFEAQNPPNPENWPGLSIVIAACNEADTIESALSTLLQQDYPGLEIIVVNDRSTDRTGEIIEALAREDFRVQPVHVEHLPARWLGKVHALHQGTQRSRGEWILYTDADIHFRPGTLRKAMALAISGKAEHLAIMPVPETDSFWLGIVIKAFGLLFMEGTHAADLDRPGSDAVMGIGAFNLVKKSALDRTEGFEWLRMEVGDDVGLGLLLKNSGALTRLMIALRDVSLTWYASLGQMFRGLEKNMFGGARYQMIRMVIYILLIWATVFAPLVAVTYPGVPYLWIFGLAAGLLLVVGALKAKKRYGYPWPPLLLIPIGQLIVSLILLRSGILCKWRGGIIWRGTLYALNDLRAGQRLKL